MSWVGPAFRGQTYNWRKFIAILEGEDFKNREDKVQLQADASDAPI